MSNKQLLMVIAVTATLSLVLAWVIERAQVRSFLAEFDQWWDEKGGGSGKQQRRKPTDGNGA
jgi:hypothetical protein